MRGIICGLILTWATVAGAEDYHPEWRPWDRRSVEDVRRQDAADDILDAQRRIEQQNGGLRPMSDEPGYRTWRDLDNALEALERKK